jgi:D-alanyl-D-alanine carboxypeptidase
MRTRFRRHAVLAVAAMLAGTACSGPTPRDHETGPWAASGTTGTLTGRTPSSADEQAADDAARAAFDNLGGRAPAFYVGIWDPPRGFFTRAYGNAVRDGATATVDDSFRIASITKTFTATVVLQLAGQGKVALGADITGYLPASLASLPALRGITVEQLLAMRSGLPDYLNNPDGIAHDIQADPHRVWTPEELVIRATRLDVAAPGTPGYTNTNFVLLGLIAQHVTGRPLAELIARLTGPLGMRHTALPASGDTDLPAPAAHGYLDQNGVERPRPAGRPASTRTATPPTGTPRTSRVPGA